MLSSFQFCSTLASDLAKFGLTESSLYKSLTVDSSRNETPEVEPQTPEIEPQIAKIFSVGGLQRQDGQKTWNLSEECAQFYEEKIKCSDEDKLKIYVETIGQATKKSWFVARKYRVSASKARSLAFARSDETLFRYFFDSTPDNENLRYGREMEPKAREEYSSMKSVVVCEPGLIISRHFPWLCATPDGLIVDQSGNLNVLEIKCPTSGYSSLLNVKYIKDGKLTKSHVYYAQIQVQLFACDAQTAHLYVYGNCDSRLLVIERDDEFC